MCAPTEKKQDVWNKCLQTITKTHEGRKLKYKNTSLTLFRVKIKSAALTRQIPLMESTTKLILNKPETKDSIDTLGRPLTSTVAHILIKR